MEAFETVFNIYMAVGFATLIAVLLKKKIRARLLEWRCVIFTLGCWPVVIKRVFFSGDGK